MRTIFEQLQKRTTKLLITEEAIERVKVISVDEFDEEENEKLQQLHKQLLSLAKTKNNSNEVGFLINLMDWSYIVIYGTENGISLGSQEEAKELICTAPQKSLVFLHNHPKNSIFSERDLESFFTADSILSMSVVCNNGFVYFLTKEQCYDKYQSLVTYNKIYEDNEEGCVREFLRICKKIGLSFDYGGE